MRRGFTRKVGKDQALNGIELCRKMYVENEGGATEVEVQSRDCFIWFPACDVKYLGLLSL